jgi:16S rRNA (guanine527-N7)-methyltransferase
MAHKNKTNVSPFNTRKAQRPKSAGGLHGKHKTPDKVFSANQANDRLQDLFKNHDFSHISHAERIKLAEFYVLLMEKQKTLNITRLLTLHEVGVKHFIDCLIIPRLVPLQFPLLDVGTGPGFPGIPLKILFPQQKIILAEGVQKRVEFLKEVREQLKLENLPIIGRNVNPWFFYPVRGVITRAVEDVRNTLQNVIFSLEKGGQVYFMKGPGVDPEIALAKSSLSEFYELEKDIPYDLPKTQLSRRLLVYRKIKNPPLPDFDEEPWPDGED